MTFQLLNFSEVSVSLNQGVVTAAIATPTSDASTQQGSQNIFSYFSSTDSLETITAANYFLSLAATSLLVNDWILVTATDGSAIIQVTSITYTALVLPPTGITTQQIIGGKANVLIPGITAANLIADYATPQLVIPAPGAGFMVVIDRASYNLIYGSAQFTGGGLVTLQYGSTQHAGGVIATTGIPAAFFTGATANSVAVDTPIVVSGADTALANTGIYLSNATAPFAVGTGTTINLNIQYHIIAVS